MEGYILDGRCSISNNLAENSIRFFSIGRKNWRCLQIPVKEHLVSASAYSIVETAKANGLSVFTYLEYLLMYMTDINYCNASETLSDLMPWSKYIKAVCGK